MSTTFMECRVREEMAGAVLKEVAAPKPAERLRRPSRFPRLCFKRCRAWKNWQTSVCRWRVAFRRPKRPFLVKSRPGLPTSFFFSTVGRLFFHVLVKKPRVF